MTYRWLIFDADGTLFDYDRAEAVALVETFESFGVTFEPRYGDVYRQINAAIWREFEQGTITASALRVERFRRLFDALGFAVDPTAFSERYLDHLAHRGDLIDGAEQVVAALFGRYRLLILTNGLSEVQRSRLAHSGLAGYFEDIVISDEVGVAKPGPQIFDVAFERMGRPAKSEVLLVGDSLSSDIAGGQAYGLDTCWFNPNGQSQPAGASIRFEIRRLAELLASLAVLPQGWTLRHLIREDAQAVLDLCTACDLSQYGETDTDLESVLDDWRRLDLARDAWLIRDASGLAVGYAWVMPRSDSYSADLYVHPAHAEAGLQAILLARCEERTREQLPPGSNERLGVAVPSVDEADQRALVERGYSPDKYFSRMQIILEEDPRFVPIWPDGCMLVPFVPGQDDRRVYDFVVEAFRWPGFVPPGFEHWRQRLIESEAFRSDLWYVLADQAGDLVATALCFEHELYGWVRNLAVSETWRNRGVGSTLLRYVFGEFYRRGQPRIALGVDSNNPDAYRFYERLGMTQVRQFVMYYKQIRGR
jgi:YjjG family noncanonical pyrimidine nucleotidase